MATIASDAANHAATPPKATAVSRSPTHEGRFVGPRQPRTAGVHLGVVGPVLGGVDGEQHQLPEQRCQHAVAQHGDAHAVVRLEGVGGVLLEQVDGAGKSPNTAANSATMSAAATGSTGSVDGAGRATPASRARAGGSPRERYRASAKDRVQLFDWDP